MTDLRWDPLVEDPAWAARVEEVCERWEGTPYREGNQRCGAGVDCVRFVAAVADELRGTSTPLPVLPADRAFHDPQGARAAMRTMIRALGARKVSNGLLRPGDGLVTAPPGGGPGHAMIAGGRRYLYHAVRGSSVVRTGLGLDGYRLVGIFRLDWSN